MKNMVVRVLVKWGNNEQDALKMVEAELNAAVIMHPKAKASKLAEIVRCLY